jgi:hypothetical protein
MVSTGSRLFTPDRQSTCVWSHEQRSVSRATKDQRGDRRAPSLKLYFGTGSAMSMRPTSTYIAGPPQNPSHGNPCFIANLVALPLS